MRWLRVAPLALATIMSALSSVGCFISADHVEVLSGTARTLVIVKLSAGASPRVFAFAPAEHGAPFVSFPRAGGETFDLVVFAYGCAPDALGLPIGEIQLGDSADAKPIPSTHHAISRGSAGGGANAFQTITEIPAEVARLRIDDPRARAIGGVQPACCPSVLATSTISFSLGGCHIKYCAPRVTKDLDACRFSLDLSACASDMSIDGDFGKITGSFDAAGQMHLDLPPAPVICRAAAAPAPHAAASLICDAPMSCGLSLFLGPPSPLFKVDTATVVPGVSRFDTMTPNVQASSLTQGYLADLGILGDRVVISSFGGKLNDDGEQACALVEEPSMLHFYDIETMRLTSTKTAPPCLTRILPSSTGHGFIGLSSAPSADHKSTIFTFGNYDDQGTMTSSASYAIPLDNTGNNYAYWAASLVYTTDPSPKIAALFGSVHTMGMGRKVAHEYIDLFEPVSFLRVEHHDLFTIAGDHATCVQSMVAVPQGRLAWVEDDLDLVRWLSDPESGLSFTGDPAEIAYHPMSDRILVPSADGTRCMYAGGRDDRLGEMAQKVFPYEKDLAPLASVVWPADPSLALAGGTVSVLQSDGTRDRRASVALFDPGSRARAIEPRFVPSLQRVGYGAVHRMVADGRGRVWMLLPWSGHVVRISPAGG